MGLGRLALAALAAAAAHAQTCAFTFAPAFVNVPATTNPVFQGSFRVDANLNTCQRRAVSNADWLVVQLGQTGTGDGIVGYAVENNLTPFARTGAITIGNAQFTVNQAANACPTTLTLQGGSGVPADGASRTLNVTTNCQWAGATNVTWITLGPPNGGTGNGAVLVNVARNPSSQARSGIVTVGSQQVAINQAGANCNYSLTPANLQATSAGGSFTATLQANCEWTAASAANWITIAPSTGTGSATLTITIAANPASADTRAGNVAIGSANLSVTQTGAPCALTLNPSSATVPANGGSGEIGVTTTCTTWTPISSASWLRVTQSAGRIAYTADPNPTAQPRNATITAGGAVFNVTQPGATCQYVVNRESIEIPAEGGNGSITVNTTAGCTWTPTSDAAWLRISAIVNGSTAGSFAYAADANPSANARSANVTLANRVIRFTQAIAANAPRIAANSVVNAADYQGGGVAPGEIVTIFGQNLGPAELTTLTLDADGTVSKELAATRVLVDGIAAPIIYTAANQLSVVIPYGIAGRTSVTLQTEYQGVRSNAINLPVLRAAPALFSIDSTGNGQAAALNETGQRNSTGIPANQQSVVVLFGTGEGLVAPQPNDGAVSGAPLPRPIETVRVLVDGREADVLYAGAAPGLVAGVLQLNVRLPAGVNGPAVPIEVRVGDASSGPRATIAVR